MQKLCRLEDIPEGGGKGLEAKTGSLFAIKKHNNVYLYANMCPHIGIELNWFPDRFLDYDNQFIHCSNHGALFLIENGECISGPCQGQSLIKIPFEIKDNWLCISP